MVGVLRRIFLLDRPQVSRQSALDIAERFFSEHGIAAPATMVSEHLCHWEVLAHRDVKGSPWVLIDNQTGAVTKSGIPPR